MRIRPETRARARALQILYAWELLGRPAVREAATGVARLTRAPLELDAAERLAAGVVENLRELDGLAGRAAENWRVGRLPLIELNILRLGIHELRSDLVPPKVAIDEALWLTHRFAGPKAAPFVNGVLDRVAHDLFLL